MPGQGRLGDKAYVPLDAHGCVACPHPSTGPAISGSFDVFVNKRPALRVDDTGVHAACCGTNTWQAQTGSQTVFINHKAAHRMGDRTKHCGGVGQLIEGSPNVIVGDSTVSPAVMSSASAAVRTGAGSGASAAASGGASGGGAGQSASGAASAGSSAAAGSAGSSAVRAATGTSANPSASARPPAPEPIPDPTFVEIFLVGENGMPISGERYRLTTPDGVVHESFLDGDGHIKIWTLQSGDCTLAFPDLDRDAWGPEGG